MLDWLIVGGGVHGTYASHRLTQPGCFERSRVRVLDPESEPLARWNHCTENAGVDYLRSPAVHHLDVDPQSLFRFAASHEGRALADWAAPYSRPGFALFQRHTRSVVDRARLRDLRVLGRARSLERCRHGWRIETEEGALDARRVLLCIGLSDQPELPAWAAQARRAGAPVHHLFERGFLRRSIPAKSRVLVIGGGLSAAQAALALRWGSPGAVTLLARHAPRVQQFDTDSCWNGPKCLAAFEAERDPFARRTRIAAARRRGTLPAEVARQLAACARSGSLLVQRGEVKQLVNDERGWIARLVDARELSLDHVVLATGFNQHRPGGDWLDAAIERESLPLAPCGAPSVDATLRWSDGLYVTGSLAELEVGPVARNLAGVRMAMERVVSAA
ncbi:MAG: FAD/NAD(P)-binding protein [Planctomycetota bacterium]